MQEFAIIHNVLLYALYYKKGFGLWMHLEAVTSKLSGGTTNK